MLMLRHINNKRAQAALGEYAVAILLVITALTTISVYFRRAIQARMYDARNYMGKQATANAVVGASTEYEPYYTDTKATTKTSTNSKTEILAGGTSGLFRKTINNSTDVNAVSKTLPPKDFGLTEQ
jgi:cell envelope opacity-associated protein A